MWGQDDPHLKLLITFAFFMIYLLFLYTNTHLIEFSKKLRNAASNSLKQSVYVLRIHELKRMRITETVQKR